MKKLSKKQWRNLMLAIALAIAAVVVVYISGFNTLPQASYGLFDTINTPKSSDRIIVLSPHEDDETIGAAGYILQALKTGAKVEVIFVTDGNKHGLKTARHEEALLASQILGVKSEDIIFFDFPDGKLSAQTNFPSRLQTAIDSFKPTVVITTLPEDTHPDHAVSGREVAKIYQQSRSFQPLFFLVHYHRFPRPLGDDRKAYLLPPINLVISSYEWRVLPITSEQQKIKAAAVLSYKTQLSLKNPILHQLLDSFVRQNELFALPQ